MEEETQPQDVVPAPKKSMSKTDKLIASIVVVVILISVIGIGWLLLGMLPSEESKFEGIWINNHGDIFIFNTDGTGNWGVHNITWNLFISYDINHLQVSASDGIVHNFDYWFEDNGNILVLLNLNAAQHAGIVSDGISYYKQ